MNEENNVKNEKKDTITNYIIVSLLILVVIGVIIKNNMNKNNNGNIDNEKSNIQGYVPKAENVNIKESEVSKITLEDYSTDVFSMKKPKGWNVEGAGTGIYYAIRVYDPQNTNNQVFLMLKIQPLLKSEAAKNQWQNYYKLNSYNTQYKLFADAVVLENPTVENFYQKFNDIGTYVNSIEPTLATFKFPTLSNFTKLEEFESKASMKSVALDSKVLRGTFKGDSGKDGEGLFMASIVNFGNQYTGGADLLYYMAYDIMAITAEKDEFINYKDILLESANSIQFNSNYVQKTIDDGNTQTKQALALNASIQKAFDSYMSAWESRQKSYDIMSQKQSDATLGYERVYDTETGDIYKAYNGFTDDYDGERYKSVTDDMYTKKTSGYIEK